jgi:hypothetical protein
MGDRDDLGIYECDTSEPYRGQVAIQVTYDPQGPEGWGGIYWQEPSNNWGTVQDAGYDLDNASSLRFYARGQDGGEQVRFLTGGIWGAHPDTLQPALSTDVVTLTKQWTEYHIDLRGRDLSRTIGGFALVTDRCLNPAPVMFYLDDVHFVLDGDPGPPLPTPTPDAPYTFGVYRDGDKAGNHYVPSGWMGDTGDIQVDECWTGDIHAGSTSIRVQYTAQGMGPSHCNGASPCNWAGVYWQDPAGNFGDRPGGYDLSGASGLSFWARGETGSEQVSFQVGGVGCGAFPYPDSLCPPLALDPAPISLTTTWKAYTIPLAGGLDLSRVVGGFMWAATTGDNPGGATFYLDDIRYLFNMEPN